jgi:uncharacterized protein YkwD
VPTPRRSILLTLATVTAVVTALAVPAVSDTAGGNCSAGGDWPSARTDLANAVLSLVNAHRASVGAPALAPSDTLTAAAVWKARHMAKYGYMSHDDPAPPVARSTADRIAACGYGGGGWGENIAYGYATAQAVVGGWLGSPGHRANIEQPAFRTTGVGAAVASNGAVYWAQTFGTSTAGASAPPPPPASPPPAVPPARVPAASGARLHVGRSPDRKAPRVDRRYVLRFPVGGPVSGQKHVACKARVGHRHARVLASWLGGGYAHCVLVAPRHTHGWYLWGTVRVAASDQLARRWFSRRVQ